MVICGPCIMMPMSEPLYKRDTRIPLPSQRRSNDLEPRTQGPQNSKTKLLLSASKQELRKSPVAISYFPQKYLRTDANSPTNLNRNSRPTQKETKNTFQRYTAPKKVESLVVASPQGKYVGTKPLKPQNITTVNKPSTQYKYGGDRRGTSLDLYNGRGARDSSYLVQAESARKQRKNDIRRISRESQGDKEILSAASQNDSLFSFRSTLLVNKSPTELTSPSKADQNIISKPKTKKLREDTAIAPKRTASTIPRRVYTSKHSNSRHSVAEVNVTPGDLQISKDHMRRFKLDKEMIHTADLRSESVSRRKSPSQKETPSNDSLAGIHRKGTTQNGRTTTGTTKQIQPMPKTFEKEAETTVNEANAESPKDIKIEEFSLESGEMPINEDVFISNEILELVQDFTESDESLIDKLSSSAITEPSLEKSDDTIGDFFDSAEETHITKPFDDLQIFSESCEGNLTEETEDGNPHVLSPKDGNPPVLSPEEFNTSTDELLLESFQRLRAEVTGKKDTEITSFRRVQERKTGLHETLMENGECKNNSQALISNEIAEEKQNFPSQDDDCDYFDIDCEVEPMPALNRPLIYGYGNRHPMRNQSTQQHRQSVNFEHNNQNDIVDDGIYPANTRASVETQLFPNNFKETYWDYFLAQNKSNIDRRRPESVGDEFYENSSCPSADFNYDPEIMLAHAIHPKSLKNATFSEYSSHIKSSIMERYTYHYNNDYFRPNNNGEFGSCFDLSDTSKKPVNSIDSGYYSESDVMKLKEASLNQTLSESENEEDDSFPSYPSKASHRFTKQNKTKPTSEMPFLYLLSKSGSDPFMNTSKDVSHNYCTDNSYLSTKNVYSHKNNKQSSSKRNSTIGENPWIHLLPDIPTRRTHLQESRDKITHKYISPAKSSYPSWQCSDDAKENTHREDLSEHFNKRELYSRKSTIEKGRKSQKKSFLPTFFRKINPSMKVHAQDAQTSQNPKDMEHLDNLLPETRSRKVPSNSFSKQSRETDNKQGFLPSSQHIFASELLPRQAKISIDDSVSESKRSNSSSSSSSSKSNHSTSSQDSVLTVIPAKYL